jgi:hypothetical protein
MSDAQNTSSEPVIACNPSAIAPAEREAHATISQEIFSKSTILEIKELATGYGFRLPLESAMLLKVAQFVANERLCCPFFTFTLVVGEELWLELTGPEGIKDLIKSDILNMIDTGDFPTMNDLQANYNAVTGADQLLS